ncbi:phage-related lysozyme [Candidatus Liberibacter solanacearum CLso-ZC1]|uniref:Lysozyme n=1 Tax=Liberibacter solanacearum (strain CLso-ZC1) TaxID=658172 RepID=E4UD89_LIBSC|nr:lysozyme [Candidatus Liberibacter solanacearum]ADR52329.1 phage-related lysozyme [Candidatus Liberibacter solanacearum CLso-ZC1]
MTDLLIDLIKRFEGLRLSAYRCSAGVWTIGYGHTRCIAKGLLITEQQANTLLLQNISKTINQALVISSILAEAGENRLSAICYFIFNIGVGRYKILHSSKMC